MEPLDLYHARREELIELLLAQRDRLAEQERVIARQQAEIGRLHETIGQVTRQVGELRLALAALTEQELEEPSGPGRPTSVPGLKPGGKVARRNRAALGPRGLPGAEWSQPPGGRTCWRSARPVAYRWWAARSCIGGR